MTNETEDERDRRVGQKVVSVLFITLSIFLVLRSIFPLVTWLYEHNGQWHIHHSQTGSEISKEHQALLSEYFGFNNGGDIEIVELLGVTSPKRLGGAFAIIFQADANFQNTFLAWRNDTSGGRIPTVYSADAPYIYHNHALLGTRQFSCETMTEIYKYDTLYQLSDENTNAGRKTYLYIQTSLYNDSVERHMNHKQ